MTFDRAFLRAPLRSLGPLPRWGHMVRRVGGDSTSEVGVPVQETRFCVAPDGTRIAWSQHGSGPPLVVSTCWLSHLQYDWRSPVWRHFLEDLGRVVTLIRYDERGHGMSDRDIADHSLSARVGDLNAVVDSANLDRFALMGMAQGGPVAIAYAAEHPTSVTRMVLYNTFADYYLERTAESVAVEEAFEHLIKVGWDRPHSEFRRVFSSMMIPGGDEQQLCWVDDLLSAASTADAAIAARRGWSEANTGHLLSQLDMPVLVLHSRNDRIVEFEHGRRLASTITDARLVTLESDNHIVLAHEHSWQEFLAEVTAFMEPDRVPGQGPAAMALLSEREREVLELASDGLTNLEIAQRLVVSVRTVERHLQNIYVKLGVGGPSARAAAVAKLLA